jgi:hypothetical protein
MRLIPSLLACSVALATPWLAAQQVLIQSTFDAAPGGGATLQSAGWSLHYGRAGALFTNPIPLDTALGDPNSGLSTGFAIIDLPGFTLVEDDFYANNLLSALVWREAAISEADRENLSSVTWLQGNRVDSVKFRVAARVGESWYASPLVQTLFNAVSASSQFHQLESSGGAKQAVFAWSEFNWQPLTFSGSTLGSSASGLSLGAAIGTLPPGAITAVGLFSLENLDLPDGWAGVKRFDTFRVTAIPEPALFGLLLGAVVTAIAFWRRR